MSEKSKSVVSFRIDDTPSLKDSAQSYQEDYPLDFHAFLEQTLEETVEDLSPSTNSVKRAGRNLRKKQGDLKSATAIIQQFRAAHEKPLGTIAYLIGRCCRELDISVKPVKRLKRLETIIDKLQRKSLDGQRENQTCVTNMNDIGGCRAIFPDMYSLNLVVDSLTKTIEGEPRVRIKDIDNYIQRPKENDCGYRSLHIIYQYENDVGKKFKIEAQLRTRFQHLWATTVEIVDILEQTRIKTHSHAPNEDKPPKQILWEELLSIMSKFIAEAEDTLEISESDKVAYSTRLTRLNGELNAIQRLHSFKMMSEEIVEKTKSQSGHVLIIVNENNQTVIFQKVFDKQSIAIAMYNEVEKVVANLDGVNSLLVSTRNLDQLSEAYPNYIGDCASFITLLRNAMNCP